jgi:predicted  nucleic acid-binding Zn-ribbon protein
MTEKSFDDWDMEMSKWRGYVVRALEDGNTELKEIKSSIKCLEEKIDKVNSRVTNIEVKVAGIGAISGILASIVLWVITKV